MIKNNNQVQALPVVYLPDGWTLSTLGEVSTKPQYGWTTKANHESGNVKLLRTTDITSGQIDWATVPYCSKEPDDLDKYLLEPGDIVVSRAGSVGVSYLITDTDNAVFASYLIRFRPIEQVDKKYVYYYLKSTNYWKAIGENTLGIAVPNVNATKLAKIEIPIAPQDEQKRIVAEIEKQFSRLDEAVENLKRVKANLNRYKASVLKAAVEGKLTEEWRKKHPDVEPADKLLERILAERRKKWEEAELVKMKAKGKVPKDDNWKKKYKKPSKYDFNKLPLLPGGWEWASVEQLAEIQLGKMLDRQKHLKGNRLAYLRNINVRWGAINTDDLLEMFFKDTELNRYGLEAGDVLVCEGGEPGRAAVWDGSSPDMKYQKALHRVRFYRDYEEHLLVYYLEFLSQTGLLKRWFTGSTIKHFTKESFSGLPVPLPPKDEQVKIVSVTEEHLSNILVLERDVDTNLIRADRLRQSILKKAFSGQLIPSVEEYESETSCELPMAAESTAAYGAKT